MASVHEITSVAHTLTTSDGGAWKTLGPAIIAAIVPGAALWFSYQQSKRTADNADRQIRAANEVATRQLDIAAKQADLAERKQVHESREDLYQAWKAVNDATWHIYRVVLNSNAEERFAKYMPVSTAFSDAVLRMHFLFRDDVTGVLDALTKANNDLFTARVAFEDTRMGSPEDRANNFDAAMKKVISLLEELRDAVRLYTVHGLKKP